jgi:hypothetical protein
MRDLKKQGGGRQGSKLLARYVMGVCVAVWAAPGSTLADNASDIQALRDQLRVMQQKIDQLSRPPTTGTVAAPAQVNQATEATDEMKRRETPALTYAGVTLYGTIDLGVAYLSHGAPLSSSWGPGLPSFVQNFSNHSITSVGGNGLSQSKVGLSGVEPLWWGDWNAVFRLETGFDPWSGRLVDAPASLVARPAPANCMTPPWWPTIISPSVSTLMPASIIQWSKMGWRADFYSRTFGSRW